MHTIFQPRHFTHRDLDLNRDHNRDLNICNTAFLTMDACIKEEDIAMRDGESRFDAAMAGLQQDPAFMSALDELHHVVSGTPLEGHPIVAAHLTNILAAADAYSGNINMQPRAVACCLTVTHLPHHCAAVIEAARKKGVSESAMYEAICTMSSSGDAWAPLVDVQGLSDINICKKLPLRTKYLVAVYCIGMMNVSRSYTISSTTSENRASYVIHKDWFVRSYNENGSCILEEKSIAKAIWISGGRGVWNSLEKKYLDSVLKEVTYAGSFDNNVGAIISDGLNEAASPEGRVMRSALSRVTVEELLRDVTSYTWSIFSINKSLLEVMTWPDFFTVALLHIKHRACCVTLLPIAESPVGTTCFGKSVLPQLRDNLRKRLLAAAAEMVQEQALEAHGLLIFKGLEMDPNLYWKWVDQAKGNVDAIFLQMPLAKYIETNHDDDNGMVLHDDSSPSMTLYSLIIDDDSGQKVVVVDPVSINIKFRSWKDRLAFAKEHTAFLVTHRPGCMSAEERDALLECMEASTSAQLQEHPCHNDQQPSNCSKRSRYQGV